MFISETKIRVLYAHTDKMGVVYYGRYYEYFESGRNDLLRNIGMPYTEIESMGYILPVLKSHAEYFAPAKYDELISVKCYLKEMPSVRMKVEYKIIGSEGLVAEGFTEHCFANIKTFKPIKPPERFIELLKKYF
jgi:acyl-CoA thioester hydrolase